jgi:CheY-like chemotaxis protein
MSTAAAQHINLMLVEDDENDVRITRRALKKSGLEGELIVTRDGQEALDYLFARPPFDDPAKCPRPGLVLLDINIPKINGIEVLRAVKEDATLRSMPILMLTTSTRQEDVAAAYAHGANGYICKPIQFSRFVEVIRSLGEYWSLVARVPT